MERTGTPSWARADEVKAAARRIGLDRLQQYLDHLTGTRAYGWYEARDLSDSERSRLAELAVDSGLDPRSGPATRLAYKKVEPRTGGELSRLAATDLTALVTAIPFRQWYAQERQRLQRDAQLLAGQAMLEERMAAAALKRAQAAYVAADRYTDDGQLQDYEEAHVRRARLHGTDALYSRANAARRTARRTSAEAKRIQSAAHRLNAVKGGDLAVLAASIEAFICQEFTPDLAPVDSVEMLFIAWIDLESISCANPKCSKQLLRTNRHRRRPLEYCSSACRMAASRARRTSAQVA